MKDTKRHSASASRSLLRFDWAAKTVLREKENHDILEGLLGCDILRTYRASLDFERQQIVFSSFQNNSSVFSY